MHCFLGRAPQPSTYALLSHSFEEVLQVLADVDMSTALLELLRDAHGKDT